MKTSIKMRTLLMILTIFSLLLLPLAAYTQSVTTMTVANSGQTPPPVSQPLIREGDFAMKLVSALNLGTAKNGTDAENILASAGIAPKNGWISDYPMTPVVIGQLQQSIEAAARAGKLPMNSNEATKAFLTLAGNEGLPVRVASGISPGETATNYGEYSNPTVINNYYYNESPPVVTYYAPPPDYIYLYTWVPYPFWWSGFWFPGYYCLNDFDVVVSVHHEREVITNHFFNPVTRRFVRIDPRTLAFERGLHGRFRGRYFGGFHEGFHHRFQGRHFEGFHEGFHHGFQGRHFEGFHEGFHHRFQSRHFEGFHEGFHGGFRGRSFGGFHGGGFHGGFHDGFHGGFDHDRG
jgi:hypothetical protein